MDANRCERCGTSMPGWDTVHVGRLELEQERILCTRCCNLEIAELSGLDEFDDPEFEPITLRDCHNRQHTFHFRSRLVPTGRVIEALELVDAEPDGYRFAVLGDMEDDPLELYRELYERMRRAMRIDHLYRGDGSIGLRHPGVVRGRVQWDRNAEDPLTEPEIVIDGRSFS